MKCINVYKCYPIEYKSTIYNNNTSENASKFIFNTHDSILNFVVSFK